MQMDLIIRCGPAFLAGRVAENPLAVLGEILSVGPAMRLGYRNLCAVEAFGLFV